jgi:hypothetical protein
LLAVEPSQVQAFLSFAAELGLRELQPIGEMINEGTKRVEVY